MPRRHRSSFSPAAYYGNARRVAFDARGQRDMEAWYLGRVERYTASGETEKAERAALGASVARAEAERLEARAAFYRAEARRVRAEAKAEREEENARYAAEQARYEAERRARWNAL